MIDDLHVLLLITGFNIWANCINKHALSDFCRRSVLHSAPFLPQSSNKSHNLLTHGLLYKVPDGLGRIS